MSNSLPPLFNNILAMDADGNFHRIGISHTFIGPRDDLLIKVAGRAGTIARDIDILNGNPVSLFCVESGHGSVAVELSSIRLATHYRVALHNDRPFITPLFRSGTDEAASHTLDWTPPTGYRIYFVMRRPNCYLVSVNTESDGRVVTRKPMIANIYGDCRICMGRSWSWNDGVPMMERLRQALNIFSSSEWNADLVAPTESVEPIIRFDPENGRTLPPIASPSALWPVVAHDAFNWVALISKANRA